MHDCRCDERLKPKDDESTCLAYTGLLEELEYLKIETRLIDEKFTGVMGECLSSYTGLIGELVVYYETMKRKLI
jgi:hypothetical protein